VNTKNGLLSFVISLTFVTCAAHVEPKSEKSSLPPNVQSFQTNYDVLWNALIKVVRYELLFPMDFGDASKGQFATGLVSEESAGRSFRYRLTGRVEPVQNAFVVTLYKDQQVLKDDRWAACPSDYVLESQIFKMIKKELGQL
jgi:hypothetical protein